MRPALLNGLEFMNVEFDSPQKLFEAGGGFSKSGLSGSRQVDWPSFSATSKIGTANPTCSVCGGRQRGAKKCSCDPEIGPVWKPIGKRRNPENEGLSDMQTGTGMSKHLSHMQVFHERWLSEAYRMLAPGGTIKAFSSTRTFHRLAVAMENVGFVETKQEAWTFGSGFPKNLNVAVVIDKAAKGHPQGSTSGDPDSPNTGKFKTQATEGKRNGSDKGQQWGAGPGHFMREQGVKYQRENMVPEALTWLGWGTALKPAVEVVLIAKKP